MRQSQGYSSGKSGITRDLLTWNGSYSYRSALIKCYWKYIKIWSTHGCGFWERGCQFYSSPHPPPHRRHNTCNNVCDRCETASAFDGWLRQPPFKVLVGTCMHHTHPCEPNVLTIVLNQSDLLHPCQIRLCTDRQKGRSSHTSLPIFLYRLKAFVSCDQ